VRTTPGATLRPPRWQPAMLRWHRTNVSWVQSWRLAIGTLPRWRDRTIIDYLATQLPGQDDVLVARLPFLRFVVVRSPEIARHANSREDAFSRLPMRVMRASAWVLEPRAMRDLRHVERVIDQLIADHRRGAIARKDNLLALLIDARDPETGHRYNDPEIHDELMTFIGAGMETTATALAWAWKLLAEHPDVRARLHDELDQVLGGRTPGAADVDNLHWTKAVVAETMRVYPPIIGLARVARNDDMLGDVAIRAGTTVAILLHGLHHNSRVWERPEEYDPARFLSDNLDRSARHATLPFGAGKRMCIASGFAQMEAVLVLATIAQQVDLDLVSEKPIRPQISFTGGPDGPMPMRPRFRARALCDGIQLETHVS
jgi:cytochrome P450